MNLPHSLTPSYLVFPYLLCHVDVVYIIGGSTDKSDFEAQTYEVIGVNITTKEVFQPHDIIHAVIWPAAAASPNRLVVCGGTHGRKPMSYCQLYSPTDDRYGPRKHIGENSS